jgi:hypothetical protein
VGTLRVRLRDAVTGAELTGPFEHSAEHGPRGAEFPATLSDWPAGTWRLAVWGAGRRGGRTVEVAPGAVVDLVVDLDADPRALAVRVVDPAGAPVERARVSAGRGAGGKTGADGACVIGGVVSPDAPVSLEVDGPGLLPVRVTVPAGERTATVTLGEGPRLALRLLDPDGLPIRDATVWLDLDPKGHAGPRLGDGTGEDGVVAWRGRLERPALASIHLDRSDQLVDDVELPAATADVEHVVRVRRAPAKVRVAGRVLDARGEPAAGASVHLASDHPGGGRQSATATAGPDGAFVVEGYAGPGAVLSAGRPDHAEARLALDLPPGGTAGVVVPLVVGATVRGRLSGVVGEPWVSAFADGRSSVEAELGPDGRFELRRLAPGRWTVQVHCTAGDEPTGSVAVDLELTDGEERTLDLEVPAEPRRRR